MKITANKLYKIIGETVMLIICMIFLIPFYYLIVNTFKTSQEASVAPMALPKIISFENYVKAFNSMNFFQSFGNSMLITVVSVVVIVLFGAMAAYPIARRKHKVYKGIFQGSSGGAGRSSYD